MNAHEQHVAARNEVARGWVQGKLHGPRDPLGSDDQDDYGRCALGAYLPSNEQGVSLRAAHEQLAAAVGVSPYQLPVWNNDPRRTKEEVLAAFDRAIAKTAPPPPDLQLSELVEAAEALA